MTMSVVAMYHDLTDSSMCASNFTQKSQGVSILCAELQVSRIHSVLEKSLKMLEFGIKTSRPLKVFQKR